jgi:kynurenine formamidase
MDAPESETWPVHRILLGAGMVVVENLCFPMEFTATDFLFTALPLHFQDADGAPVRAIALSAVGQL